MDLPTRRTVQRALNSRYPCSPEAWEALREHDFADDAGRITVAGFLHAFGEGVDADGADIAEVLGPTARAIIDAMMPHIGAPRTADYIAARVSDATLVVPACWALVYAGVLNYGSKDEGFTLRAAGMWANTHPHLLYPALRCVLDRDLSHVVAKLADAVPAPHLRALHGAAMNRARDMGMVDDADSPTPLCLQLASTRKRG